MRKESFGHRTFSFILQRSYMYTLKTALKVLFMLVLLRIALDHLQFRQKQNLNCVASPTHSLLLE